MAALSPPPDPLVQAPLAFNSPALDPLTLDPLTLGAILAMAIATYLCRAGGYALIGRLPPSRFISAWLSHIPGAVFMALVVPGVVKAGWPGAAGAIATLAVARAGAGLLPSLAAGLGAVWATQQLLA